MFMKGLNVFHVIYVLNMDWFNDLCWMNVVILDQYNDVSNKFR